MSVHFKPNTGALPGGHSPDAPLLRPTAPLAPPALTGAGPGPMMPIADATGGPAGFIAVDAALAKTGGDATLTNARSLLGKATAAIGRLPTGARVEGDAAQSALSVLAQLAKVQGELSPRTLGPAASSADAMAARADVRAGYAGLRAWLETAPGGDLAKAKLIVNELVRGELAAIEPGHPPTDVGAALAVPLSAKNLALAESFQAFYERGATTRSHFMKVLHLGRAEADLGRIEAQAGDSLDAKAFVAHGRGLLAHRRADDAAAIGAYGSALALLGGSNATISYNIAAAHAREGHNDKALAALSSAVKASTTPSQAHDLLGLAAGDPDMWRLMAEPQFHALLADVGGPQLTRGDDGLHHTRAWNYQITGAYTRDDIAEDVARLARETGAQVSLTWKGGVGELTGARVASSGADESVVLATFTEKPGVVDVRLAANDRLRLDPAALHAWFADIKLRDAPL